MSELLSCFEDIVSMFSEHQNDFFDIVPILRYPFIKYALESLFGSFESEEVMAKFIEGYNNACISWNDYSSGKIMGNLKDDKNFIAATKELRWILKRIILHRKTHSSDDKRFIDVIIESVPLIEDAVDEALVFFIGSSFTVMNSILFTLYYLARYPDVQEKVPSL